MKEYGLFIAGSHFVSASSTDLLDKALSLVLRQVQGGNFWGMIRCISYCNSCSVDFVNRQGANGLKARYHLFWQLFQ